MNRRILIPVKEGDNAIEVILPKEYVGMVSAMKPKSVKIDNSSKIKTM